MYTIEDKLLLLLGLLAANLIGLKELIKELLIFLKTYLLN